MSSTIRDPQSILMLTIETCTDTATLGLVRGGAVLGEMAFPSRHTLAARQLLRLDWLLTECGVTKTDLGAIALSLGPGSFTGVRLGAAMAKVLAHGLGIPLLGVSTLDALAYPFRGATRTLLVPMINARRQQAYLACYRGEAGALCRLTPDLALSAAPFAATLAEQRGAATSVMLIGQLDALPAGFIPPHDDLYTVCALVTPRALAMLAVERLARGEADDPVTLTPVYLRSAAD